MAQGTKLENAFFLGLLVLVTIAFVAVLSGYLLPVFWASTLAVLFYPLQRWLYTRLNGRRSVAAILTVIFILITVIVPAMALISAVASEAAAFYARLESGELDPLVVVRWLEARVPMASDWLAMIGLDFAQLQQKVAQFALGISQFLASSALSVGQSALSFGIAFFLAIYLLFFFLRDGEELTDSLVRVLPLGDERERALFAKFAEVSRATIKGTLVIGVIQGTLGGLIFAYIGIAGAVFWGVVMGVLSLLPAVGATLVWVPTAIILAVQGQVTDALILTVFGAVVIGLADNLLRPILVGRDTRMPDYLVLLSTLGGLGTFGISGFVIGPVIAALFLTVWVMFEAEHRVMDPEGDMTESELPDNNADT